MRRNGTSFRAHPAKLGERAVDRALVPPFVRRRQASVMPAPTSYHPRQEPQQNSTNSHPFRELRDKERYRNDNRNIKYYNDTMSAAIQLLSRGFCFIKNFSEATLLWREVRIPETFKTVIDSGLLYNGSNSTGVSIFLFPSDDGELTCATRERLSHKQSVRAWKPLQLTDQPSLNII